MRAAWLGDIYSQAPTMSDATWEMVFNIENPRWTDMPLLSEVEINLLNAGEKHR